MRSRCKGISSKSSHRIASWIDVADFVLSLRAQPVPKKVCENIIHEFKSFGSRVQSECCNSNEASASGSVGKSDSPSLVGLKNVDTFHKLLSFAKKEHGYINPIPQYADGKLTGKPASQYVPLTSQLQACLECQDFPGHVMSHENLNQCKYREIFDGSLHKQGKQYLHLILYYDEFNIANPIGNKTSKHSIGAIYYCIANSSQFSSLSSIHLAMLFHSQNVKKLSWERILAPLVK